MATFNFKPSSVEPMAPRSYAPLPNDDYEMMVTKSEIKATKAGNGHYLELEMQVISGEHSGRRHWERLNIDNPNKQAEDIAKAALAALCMAVGVDDMQDTDQLHDIPFIARVEIDRKDPERNRVVGYEAALETATAAPAAKPAAPAASKPGKKPWE